MAQEIKIFIIILNYNNASDTLGCLNSVGKLKSKHQIKTIVVDNASSDDSVKQIDSTFPKLNLLQAPKNLGFAAGVNLGIKLALKNKADFVLLLNNDALIDNPALIDRLIALKADIAAPLIKFKKNQKTLIDHGGRIDYLFARNTHLYKAKKFDYLSGVCLLIKTNVFEKIGLFDENYFLYYEDVDFCLKAKRAGFKLTIAPNTFVFHSLSASANKLGKKKIKILASSQIYFARKYLPTFSSPFYYLYHLYLKIKSL